MPPKPDASRAGEGGRDERDYRLKIVFRTEEIVRRRSSSRATWTSAARHRDEHDVRNVRAATCRIHRPRAPRRSDPGETARTSTSIAGRTHALPNQGPRWRDADAASTIAASCPERAQRVEGLPRASPTSRGACPERAQRVEGLAPSEPNESRGLPRASPTSRGVGSGFSRVWGPALAGPRHRPPPTRWWRRDRHQEARIMVPNRREKLEAFLVWGPGRAVANGKSANANRPA